jgi:hypothetical protein
MTSITTEKRGRTVRINISANEFAQLVPDDANRALVKHWIDIGREREGIREHVDEVLATRFSAQKDEIETLREQVADLKKVLDDFIAFFAQVAHSLTISTTAKSQFDLESIHFDKINGNKLSHQDEQTYKLALIKHVAFKQLMSILLPDVEQRFNLTNFLRDESKNDA